MKHFLQQIAGLAGAGAAAACCLGIWVVASALTAVGLGFLVRDAILLPLFALAVAFSLWTLYRSARPHGNLAPFFLGVTGAVLAAAGLTATITGLLASPWPTYVGLGVLLAGSVWDIAPWKKPAACACERSPSSS